MIDINRINPGSIEDLVNASKSNIKITLLRKNFQGQLIKGITINDSMIAKCLFQSSSIYGSTFINCDFVSCDFSLADFYGVTFNNCRLNGCNFDKSKMNMVKFDEECSLTGCSFNNVDLLDKNVEGLDEKDIKIVSENIVDDEKIISLGFNKSEDNCFEIASTDNTVKLSVCFDTESDIYRAMFFINDQCYYTNDLFDLDEYNNSEFYRILLNTIKTGFNKFKIENPEMEETNNSVKEVISKLNKGI